MNPLDWSEKPFSYEDLMNKRDMDITEIDMKLREQMYNAAKQLYNFKSQDREGFWKLMDDLFK